MATVTVRKISTPKPAAPRKAVAPEDMVTTEGYLVEPFKKTESTLRGIFVPKGEEEPRRVALVIMQDGLDKATRTELLDLDAGDEIRVRSEKAIKGELRKDDKGVPRKSFTLWLASAEKIGSKSLEDIADPKKGDWHAATLVTDGKLRKVNEKFSKIRVRLDAPVEGLDYADVMITADQSAAMRTAAKLEVHDRVMVRGNSKVNTFIKRDGTEGRSASIWLSAIKTDGVPPAPPYTPKGEFQGKPYTVKVTSTPEQRGKAYKCSVVLLGENGVEGDEVDACTIKDDVGASLMRFDLDDVLDVRGNLKAKVELDGESEVETVTLWLDEVKPASGVGDAAEPAGSPADDDELPF